MEANRKFTVLRFVLLAGQRVRRNPTDVARRTMLRQMVRHVARDHLTVSCSYAGLAGFNGMISCHAIIGVLAQCASGSDRSQTKHLVDELLRRLQFRVCLFGAVEEMLGIDPSLAELH